MCLSTRVASKDVALSYWCALLDISAHHNGLRLAITTHDNNVVVVKIYVI